MVTVCVYVMAKGAGSIPLAYTHTVVLHRRSNMKTYIVYVDGIEKGLIKAASHNAAEKKAAKQNPGVDASRVSVAYTEV